MVPEVKNAPYGRLALVGCDVNPVSWRLHATKHNKEIQRLTRVFRFVGLLLLSKWQKATVIAIAAMIPMIQSTILSPATSTLALRNASLLSHLQEQKYRKTN